MKFIDKVHIYVEAGKVAMVLLLFVEKLMFLKVVQPVVMVVKVVVLFLKPQLLYRLYWILDITVNIKQKMVAREWQKRCMELMGQT